MIIRSLIHKKTAVLTIASMLLLSFCFLPCSGSMSLAKAASQHHGMGHGAGDHDMYSSVSHHSHKVDVANAVLAKGLSTCDDCKIPVPAIIKSSGDSSLIALNIFSDEIYDNFISLPLEGKFLKLGLPPPTHKNHIYILNSTYLI